MKDKILFLLDMEWIHFGIANFLQNLYPCDLYALVDIDHASKDFYQNQKILEFQKLWFYRDYHSKINEKFDMDYLISFEKKYNISLWKIAFGERFFYQYNDYKKFSSNQILSILEKDCKLFEKILDEVDPDYLIIKFTDSHQSQLLLELCKNRKIKTLNLTSTRFGFRYGIFSDYDKIDENDSTKLIEPKFKNFEQLRDYLKKFHASKEISSLESTVKIPPFLKIKKYFQYLKSINHSEYKKYYINLGRTNLKIISNLFFIKRYFRNNYVDKNLLHEIPNKIPYVYFPLHYEPERQLLQQAPFFRDQLTLIVQIAQSLPVGYQLVIKEHVSMYLNFWREKSYYEKIKEIPNVILLHPDVSSEQLMKNSSLVITIAGTSGLEALFHNKPVIVFSDVSYSVMSAVYRIREIETLPSVINKMLSTQVDVDELSTYVNNVENNTFELDMTKLYGDFNTFFTDFNSVESNVDESQMITFLDKNKKIFEMIANEYIKKINFYNLQT